MEKNMIIIANEHNMQKKLAKQIANLINKHNLIIYLDGNIGAGKTSLVKAIMQNLNYQDTVNSPSFNLLNVYENKSLIVIHCDLYRFKNFDAIEMLLLEDYFDHASYLIEWPYQAKSNTLPDPDITIKIDINNNKRLYNIKFNNKSIEL